MFSKSLRFSIVAPLALVCTLAGAQTFRGTVGGTVRDSSGAVVSDAAVELSNPATGTSVQGKSNKAGSYNFPEIAPGLYNLTITAPGFASKTIEKIDVQVTKVVSQDVTLSLGTENTVIDVAANAAVQTDTESSALVSVIDSKAVQEMPLNGRDFTRLTHFAPGVSALTNSVNGQRTTSINFQVDGADNVDSWLGIVASNQGGIASVAGGLIPIEAIDQFSMQAGGEADQGRNAGANSNMVLRSGTNKIHGDLFYYDRNEFFAAISPVNAVNSKKNLLRNHQGGFTLGGPLWRDHTFLFLAGEFQIAKINTAIVDTVLSDQWISAATSFMANPAFRRTPTQLSQNLYGLLFPNSTKGAAASSNNFLPQGLSNYNSYNGIVKLDHHFNDRHALSLRYLGTTGTQTAPTSSYYAEYFQTAPMHIHNVSVVDNYTISSKLLNQLTLGTNYFLQNFNDANQSFNPGTNAGLNLGLSGIIAAGAPTISINTFDITGATQPSGRTDVTGHITDTLHWTLGRHNLKFGGEYRRMNVNFQYYSNSRGSFTFDGTRGPWFTQGTGRQGTTCNAAANTAYNSVVGQYGLNTSLVTCAQLAYVSDFLSGTPSSSSGAKLLNGNLQRVYLLNTEEAWAQDDFRISKHLNLNLGLRYTVPGVVHAERDDVYSFVPGSTPGFRKGLYNNYYFAVAPRVGFSYSFRDDNTTVLRGSWGRFYDIPGAYTYVYGTSTNGGASYAQNNPAGPDAAVVYINNNLGPWQVGVNPFLGTATPTVGAVGVDPNIKMPYSDVFSLNVEQQLSKNLLFTLGYVGTEGRRLPMLLDLNQPQANGTGAYAPRPYANITSFTNESPAFAGTQLQGINQLRGAASSNFNSLQTTVRGANYKGLSWVFNYTWSKSMDDGSSPTTPMNSYNLHQDYGLSTFDVRHVINGNIFYTVPTLVHSLQRLTGGFQLNALYTYSSGLPLNPLVSGDNSKTYQLKDRPNYNPAVNPYTGVMLNSSTATARSYRYLQNNGAFTVPTSGTYGNEHRDMFIGPKFRTIDFSLFKRTAVTERVNTEFRAEVFNIFNFNNFAAPSVSNITSGSFGTITNTRNGANAPGIGFGEPFNVQFAFKVSF